MLLVVNKTEGMRLDVVTAEFHELALGHPFPADRERALPDSLPSWRPFPEVPAVLRALQSEGRRLAILSNVDRALLRSSIARLGVEPHLAVTAEDCRSYKPARGHWDRFRELSGAAAAATVHVAASQFRDIVPAAALGFRTVFVNRHGEPVAAAPTRAVHHRSRNSPSWEEFASTAAVRCRARSGRPRRKASSANP